MQEETHDIHKVQNTLHNIENKIRTSKKILSTNKKHFEDFFELQKARGFKPTTIRKDLYSAWFIGSHLNKDFKKCDKKDIIKLCGAVEAQQWSVKTKKEHLVFIKKFWKWLYNIDDKTYPVPVSWISTNEKIKNRKLPEELLTEEDIERMVQVCDNPRDKAFLLLAYESGARIGEILNIKIKHVIFNQFGAYIMLNGKTGMRRVTVIMSVPALATFIDLHPCRDNPDSFLFLTNYNAIGKKGEFVPLTYGGARKILITLAKKAGIQKRVHPHLLRHSSATRAAKFLTEAQMKVYYGWTSGSNMPSIYVHLSSRDVEDAIKKMNKIEITQEETVKATIKICQRCKQKNSFGSKFCNSCGYPLDLKTAMEIEEGRQSWDDKMATIVKDKEIRNLILKKYGSLVKNK